MTDIANRIRVLKQEHTADCARLVADTTFVEVFGNGCACDADAWNARVESIALAAEQVERETVERCAKVVGDEAERIEKRARELYMRGGSGIELSKNARAVAKIVRNVSGLVLALLATGEPEPATGGKE